MSEAADMVAEFHRTFKVPVKREPSVTAFFAYGPLRRDLIMEEAHEFAQSIRDNNFEDAADALADLLYVTYGAALTFGLDLDAIVEEVHRSNMTKVWESAREVEEAILDPDHPAVRYEGDIYSGYVVYREDGKVLKPPTFEPPNLGRFIDG